MRRDRQTFGALLQEYRSRANLTLARLAAQLQVQPRVKSTVHHWESGTAHPAPDELACLYRLLDLDADERAELAAAYIQETGALPVERLSRRASRDVARLILG